MSQSKVCTGCKRRLPIYDFGIDNRTKGGRRAQCLACHRAVYHRTKKCGDLPPRFWTPERIDLLRTLWGVRPTLSAREIARRIGCTRNAVLGEVFRLNLPKRAGGVRKAPDDDPEPLPPPPEPHPFARLGRGECCFPIGHPSDGDFAYCGQPVGAAGRDYCDMHHMLTHQRPPSAKQDEARA